MRSRARSAPNARAATRKAGSVPVEDPQKTVMEFMDGLYNRTTMPLTYVTVSMSRVGSSENRFDAQFAVNAGTTETMASRSALIGAGIEPAGMTTYELADGSLHEYSFGLAQIEFMG